MHGATIKITFRIGLASGFTAHQLTKCIEIFLFCNGLKLKCNILRIRGQDRHPPPVFFLKHYIITYRGADKSLARPTSRCILFDGENISFDAGIVIYVYK